MGDDDSDESILGDDIFKIQYVQSSSSCGKAAVVVVELTLIRNGVDHSVVMMVRNTNAGGDGFF